MTQVMNVRIGFVSFSWSGGFDRGFAVTKMRASRELLHRFGQVIGPDQPIFTVDEARQAAQLLESSRIDALILQQGTFSSAEPLPIIIERLTVPIALWALREPFDGGPVVANSLCGVHLMASILARLGRSYHYFYLDPEDGATSDQVGSFLTAARTFRQLRTMRLGLVGGRVPGFFPLDVDEMALRRQIGAEVVHIDLSEIFFGAEPQTAELAAAHDDLLTHVTNARAMPAEKLYKVARSTALFRRIIRQYQVDCLAVKCWPEFLDGYGVAACATLARLGGNGIVSGCEGDVNGTITSFVLQMLSGGDPTFLADLIGVNEGGNTGILWHCGVAPVEMAAPGAPVDFGVDFGGVGMNLEFTLKPGRITVARVGALHGRYRMLVTGGEVLPAGLLARGTMGLVRFDAPVTLLLDTLILGGWEHHVSMVYGDVRDSLRALARMLNIELTEV